MYVFVIEERCIIMKEIEIVVTPEGGAKKDTTIEINSICKKQGLLYKFFVGKDGIWETFKDFNEENKMEWKATEEGKYIIMVQAKAKESSKPYDYTAKIDYNIGVLEEKLIKNVNIDKTTLNVGEKLNINVECSKVAVVYKFWMKEDEKWELIKDYSSENSLNLSVKTSGNKEILVECKSLESNNNFDDFAKVQFTVLPIKKIEIIDFKCLSSELLVDSDIDFQIETSQEDNRMVMYKFLKINSQGVLTTLQDYSTKRIVSFKENIPGDYRLLCLAKDMYSPNEYDDRAVINYNIKLYKPITIKSFITDLSSPQMSETTIELRAAAKGGKNLQYRFVIDGNKCENSGYIKESTYLWTPDRPGKYNIELWVKDASFDGKYEVKESLEFIVDEKSKNVVKLEGVILDKYKEHIKNEAINIKANAVGGIELRYSFIVLRKGKELEKIEYGTCDWVNFTPEEAGQYQVEVRVKDKYSRKEYDCHELIDFEVLEYSPAHIEYILLPTKEGYLVGDDISFDVVTRRSKKIKMRYILRIDGHKVEDTNYVDSKKYSFTPKCGGRYTVEVLAKNVMSNKEFDAKREVRIFVKQAVAITNAKIQCDKTEFKVNDPIIFSARCDGGKDVYYEFYLLEQGEWNLVQKYSKKNYYSFIPFVKGKYTILVLCKSEYKNCAYEDYYRMDFTVQ
jgi:hypothetical protein